MNIVVIGPGALGLLFAGRLAAGGQAISLLDHNPQRAAELDNHILLSEKSRTADIALTITADPAVLTRAELILLCVKSHQVAAVLSDMQPHLQANTVVIGLQNGISHLPLFQEQQGLMALGVTAQGATLLAPGKVRHGGNGPTFIGMARSGQDNSALTKIAALFSSCKLSCRISANINEKLWRKLFINCGINGLTVLHDCNNGKLLNIPIAKQRLRKLVSEAMAVANRLGIEYTDDPVAQTLEVCQATADNISSMLQDIRAGRATEIRAINGAVCLLAKEHGISTPENDLLVQEVLAIEKGKKQQYNDEYLNP